jgi:hypothetical protein
MTNSGAGLIGTAIGVGFGLYALGMLNQFAREQEYTNYLKNKKRKRQVSSFNLI